jgi:hypothetical protein
MDDGLGKLVQTLKDKCPDCGHNLQVRSQGQHFIGTRYFSIEEVVCPTCQYSLPIKPEKRRMKKNEDFEWD